MYQNHEGNIFFTDFILFITVIFCFSQILICLEKKPFPIIKMYSKNKISISIKNIKIISNDLK